MNEIGREELLGYLDAFVTSHKLHFNKITPRDTRAYHQIYALISDYDTNLTDCTEAIDALIEERDALIEDSKAYDERIDEIVEHYRRLDSEPSEVDEDVGKSMRAISEVDRLAQFILKNYAEEIGKGDFVHGESAADVAIRLLSQKRVVADNTQNLSSHGRNGVNEADK